MVDLYNREKQKEQATREKRKGFFLNDPSIPLVPRAAVQTRLWMTKTSSSAAGVSLRVCLGQTGTLQQEETGGGGWPGDWEIKRRKTKKRKVFAGGEERRRRATCTSEGQKRNRIVHAVT